MDTQIAMLWMRGRLSFLERLCVQSFLDAGHHVALFSYDEIDAVPDGVERRDASDVLPEDGFLVHERTGSPALHSDLFRYKLLAQQDRTIWADTDAYCMRPFDPVDGHFYGWESVHHVNGGVLALPSDSLTLNALLDFTRDEYAIPPWIKKWQRRDLREAAERGEPVHVGHQTWGVWGPHAITHFLGETGEISRALPQAALYPYSFADRRMMLRRGADHSNAVTDETRSIHLYGRRMRKRLAEAEKGFPDPTSLLGQLLIKHRIDPCEYPLRELPDPDRDHPFARVFREAAEGRTIHQSAGLPKSKAAGNPQGPRPLECVLAVTTMRNEGPYILDWVAYHLGVGITHFLVYTNDCDDQTDLILNRLAALGVVTRVDNPVEPGERPQRVALEHASNHPLLRAADAYVVMDVDEYVNIHVGEGRLADLFAACGDPDLISMTWRFFGCDSALAFEDRPVPAQFTRAAPLETRKPHQNWGFNTIVRREAPNPRIGDHRPLEPTGPMPKWTNGSGRQMPDGYLDSGWRSNKHSWGYDLVTLNHYAIRSIDGFLVKRDRGRTNHVNRDQGVTYWNTHNRNDEEDRSILDRLHLMEPARKRFRDDPVLSSLHAEACAWHMEKARTLADEPDTKKLLSEIAPSYLAQSAMKHALASDEVSKQARPEDEADRPKPAAFTPTGDPIHIGKENEKAFAALLNRVGPRFPHLEPDGIDRSSGKVVIVTSMKNEGAFILEWIAYHLSIGVDHFLVYTNDCDDPTEAILQRLSDLGYVTRRDNPFDRASGQKPQRGALNAAWQEQLVQDADWVGVIDVDEFINIHVGDGTLGTLFKEMNDPNVISMTWRFFGSRGIERFEDRWITEQFVRCAPCYLPRPRLGWGFKSLFHKSAPVGKLGVHRPLDLDPARMDELRWVNGSGRIMPEHSIQNATWFSRKNSIGYGMVTLNHYILRSAESFLVKRQRGRINHVDQDQGLAYWIRRNYATEVDTSIHHRLPAAKAALARLTEDKKLADLHKEAVTWHQARIRALRADPDYDALFEAITNPSLDDAIFTFDGAEATDAGEVDERLDSVHAAE